MDSIDRNLWVVLLENASLWNYKAYAANQPALIHIHIIAIVWIGCDINTCQSYEHLETYTHTQSVSPPSSRIIFQPYSTKSQALHTT